MNLGCGSLLRQHNKIQFLGIVLFQKAAHPATGAQQFRKQGQGLAGPAQHHHMVFKRYRCETAFQVRHLGYQPSGQDGHQGAHEHHVPQNCQQRRDDSLPGADIIPQISGIGQPKESPPDGRARLLEVSALGDHQKAANQGNQADEHTDH